MKRICLALVIIVFMVTPSLAINNDTMAVQHTDMLFFSKVLLVVIIAFVGILALRAFRKSDEAN